MQKKVRSTETSHRILCLLQCWHCHRDFASARIRGIDNALDNNVREHHAVRINRRRFPFTDSINKRRIFFVKHTYRFKLRELLIKNFTIFIAIDANTLLRPTDFANTETQPRFFTEEDRSTERIHVHAPARLEDHACTVLKDHPTDTEIFDFSLFERGVPSIVQTQIVGSDTGDRNRFRVSHQIERSVERVNTDVRRCT